MDFDSLRKEYSTFEYQYYKITENEENITLKYGFEIVGLSKFEPEIIIKKKNFNWKNIDF